MSNTKWPVAFLTPGMLWAGYGLWLSRPVCTKAMVLWRRPGIDGFFSHCAVQGWGPMHSYQWSVTARGEVTLREHTGPSAFAFVCTVDPVLARADKEGRSGGTGSRLNQMADAHWRRTNLWRGLPVWLAPPYPSRTFQPTCPPTRHLSFDEKWQKSNPLLGNA